MNKTKQNQESPLSAKKYQKLGVGDQDDSTLAKNTIEQEETHFEGGRTNVRHVSNRPNSVDVISNEEKIEGRLGSVESSLGVNLPKKQMSAISSRSLRAFQDKLTLPRKSGGRKGSACINPKCMWLDVTLSLLYLRPTSTKHVV